MGILYLVTLSETDCADAAYFRYLPKERMQKLYRYRKPMDQLRCLAAGLAVCAAAADWLQVPHEQVQLVTAEGTAPFAKVHGRKLSLSISHAGPFVLGMADDTPCGVDTEEIRTDRNWMPIAKSFFHEQETAALLAEPDFAAQTDSFYRFWTMKEAYLKYRGTGLQKALSSFWINFCGKDASVQERDGTDTSGLLCRSFYHAGNWCAVISESGMPQVKTVSYQTLVKQFQKGTSN